MGRTAAAEWKQMASPRTTAWSQCGVCSQGWPFCGGPEDHLGTPEADDPWSSSKHCSQYRAPARRPGAAVGMGTTVTVHGSVQKICLPSAAHWVFMQEDARSLPEPWQLY